MILQDKKAMELMELAFVCDLFAPDNVMNDEQLPIAARAASLDNWQAYKADLIVEVAHPSISTEWGAKFLSEADYMIASTTTFADRDTEMRLKTAANEVRARLHLQLYSQAGSAARCVLSNPAPPPSTLSTPCALCFALSAHRTRHLHV